MTRRREGSREGGTEERQQGWKEGSMNRGRDGEGREEGDRRAEKAIISG